MLYQSKDLKKIKVEIEKMATAMIEDSLKTAKEGASDSREQAINLIMLAKVHKLVAEAIEENLLDFLSIFEEFVNAPVTGQS